VNVHPFIKAEKGADRERRLGVPAAFYAQLTHRRYWAPATEAGGVAPLRIHDLRHTAVAFWIAAGASSKEIARRAGHASVVTVLDRYGHLLPGEEDRVTDALDLMALAAEVRPAAQVRTLR